MVHTVNWHTGAPTYTVDAIIITLHESKNSKVIGSVIIVVVDTKIARSQYL